MTNFAVSREVQYNIWMQMSRLELLRIAKAESNRIQVRGVAINASKVDIITFLFLAAKR